MFVRKKSVRMKWNRINIKTELKWNLIFIYIHDRYTIAVSSFGMLIILLYMFILVSAYILKKTDDLI